MNIQQTQGKTYVKYWKYTEIYHNWGLIILPACQDENFMIINAVWEESIYTGGDNRFYEAVKQSAV